jgi:hypothetical protein
MIIRGAFSAIALFLLLIFLLTAGEAAILRTMYLHADFRIGEMHHEYLGILLVGAGWFVHGGLGAALMALGVLLMLDDTWQHWKQTWDSEPNYQSPLHWLFAVTLWQLGWVRRLSAWLDARL